MRVGGDPDELVRVATGGPGQAFTLDHTARMLEHAAERHTLRNRGSRVDATVDAGRLHRLARSITRLDHWVLLVAAALRAADATTVGARLLLFGAGHPATDAVVGPRAVPTALPVERLTDRELDRMAGWPRLGGGWRDRVHRERLQRWAAGLDQRIAEVEAAPSSGVLDRLAAWIDDRLVDRLSRVVDLHVTREEIQARLEAEAAGAAWLLARHDLTVWSFDAASAAPTAGPALRVALGDVASATHLVVLLPGTGSGLHAPLPSLAQAAALHARAEALADDGATVATVLDLYDAPADLGRAADPRPGRAAGHATAGFLDDLPGAPVRTTLVGHSYGAFAAANALGTRSRGVDALVLLGAPGTGRGHRDELAATEVWAAQAEGEPIRAVADLDEHLAGLPPDLRPTSGPLADPLVALGPDPYDADFGSRRLPTAVAHASDDRTPNRGHVDYLAPGTVALDNVARVVLDLPPR